MPEAVRQWQFEIDLVIAMLSHALMDESLAWETRNQIERAMIQLGKLRKQLSKGKHGK